MKRPLILQRRAFSLIELLIVVVIIGIIAAFGVPAVGPILRGSALSQSGTLLMDQMSMARQYAVSQSRTVEVRFYRFGDPEVPGEKADTPASGQFRALQYFERTDNGLTIPVGKVQRLSDGIMMNAGAKLSTILGEDQATRLVLSDKVKQDSKSNVELPRGVGFNYDYVFFRFLPSGATDLSPIGMPSQNSAGGLWHITLHALSDLPRTNPPASDKAPPDYVCWAVDPVSGVGKIYKPGIK